VHQSDYSWKRSVASRLTVETVNVDQYPGEPAGLRLLSSAAPDTAVSPVPYTPLRSAALAPKLAQDRHHQEATVHHERLLQSPTRVPKRIFNDRDMRFRVPELDSLTPALSARDVVPSFKCDDAHYFPGIALLRVRHQCINTHP